MTTEPSLIDAGTPAAPAAPAAAEGGAPAAPAAAAAPSAPAGGDNIEVEYKGEKITLAKGFAAEDGTVNAGALAKAFKDTQTALSEAQAKATAPETYTIGIAEEQVAILTGGKAAADDPVMGKFMEFAKAKNLTQEQLDGVLGFAAELTGQNTQTPEQIAEAQAAEQKAEMDELTKVYGDKTPAVLSGLTQWGEANIKAQLGEGAWNEFRFLCQTAEGVRLAEALATGKLRAMDGNVPSSGATGAAAGVTEKDAKAMMRDPRYWRDRDPAYVAKVAEVFQKLYPS